MEHPPGMAAPNDAGALVGGKGNIAYSVVATYGVHAKVGNPPRRGPTGSGYEESYQVSGRCLWCAYKEWHPSMA